MFHKVSAKKIHTTPKNEMEKRNIRAKVRDKNNCFPKMNESIKNKFFSFSLLLKSNLFYR